MRLKAPALLAALTIAQRQERRRLEIIDALKDRGNMTARQISYELQIRDIWLSPAKLSHFIKDDKHLQKQVRVEAQRVRGSWALVYSLKARWGGE